MSDIQAQQLETQIAEVDYHFRKKDGIKRESVSVQVPVPTASALIAILSDESDDTKKTRNTILDAVSGIVTSYVRTKVDADEQFNQESLNAILPEVTLHAIANLPRSERSTVTKDDLESFAKVYIAIMPELAGISAKGAESAGTIFAARIRPALGNNKALEVLQGRLQEFVEKAPEEVTAEHGAAIEYLLGRLEEALGINFDVNAL